VVWGPKLRLFRNFIILLLSIRFAIEKRCAAALDCWMQRIGCPAQTVWAFHFDHILPGLSGAPCGLYRDFRLEDGWYYDRTALPIQVKEAPGAGWVAD
jgi:hypothetical protein